MKKTLRKAMLSTICMLIVGVMSLTGVTYAWFTSGADAAINNVTVDVVAADGGIQFSKNGTDWMSQTTSMDEIKFAPVSTVGALNEDREIKFFSGAVNPEKMSEIKTTETTAGYFALPLYIRNVSGSQITVQLQDLEIPSDALAASKYAQYASRIALVIEKKYTSTTAFEASFEENYTYNGPAATVIVYEPFSELHTETAKKVTGATDNSGPIPYSGVKKVSSTIVKTPAATDDQGNTTSEPVYYNYINANHTELVDVVTGLTYEASDVTFTLENDEYIEVTIYVWIEGQDIDCENSVSGGKYSFNLVFEKPAAPASGS